tara:strand:+ start:119 stop:1051 length:933 start_codon:yes stop_codon:yes gene_type:complete
MKNDTDTVTSNNLQDEIDLRQLIEMLWAEKILIFGFTIFFSLAAVLYSLSLPNIYQSSALLSPVSQNESNQSSSNMGGLASLAGIEISRSGGKEAMAVKKLNTLSFFTDNIYPNIFLPDLMAIESWNANANTTYYKSNLFDNESGEWVRNYQYPKSQIPSPQESYKIFKKQYKVIEDEATGFVTIKVKHQSPITANAWTKLIVDQINDFFRAKDKLEAQASIDFLSVQMSQTSQTEIKQVIAALLQQKMKQMTLIEANEFYVFAYLDPPMVMEEKIEPVRSKISILGALLGLLLGIIFVIVRNYFSESKY